MVTHHRRPPSCVTRRAARELAPPASCAPQPYLPEELCRLVASEKVTRREGGPPSRLRRFEYRLPVYGSFSVEDKRAHFLDLTWGERERTELFMASPYHTLVWAPDEARASLVVELHDVPPGAADLGAWDHVAEFPLAVPSGRLVLLTDVVGPIPEHPVYPGPQRVRLSIGGLASVGEEDGRPVGGFLRYRLTLWPRDPSPGVVLKQWAGAVPRRPGPQATHASVA